VPPRATIFDRYIGIDYSGAETPTENLKGLRVYLAGQDLPLVEVYPLPIRSSIGHGEASPNGCSKVCS
jgi:hypothetical protein